MKKKDIPPPESAIIDLEALGKDIPAGSIIFLRPRRGKPPTGKLPPLDPDCCPSCTHHYCSSCAHCHTPGCRFVRVVCAEAQEELMNHHRRVLMIASPKKKHPFWQFWKRGEADGT